MSAAFEQLTEEHHRAIAERPAASADTELAGEDVLSLTLVGLVTILVATWGGIAPYVGPVFGYDATGAGAWHWTLPQAVLAAAPGGVGVIAGLSMLAASSRDPREVHRASLVVAGSFAMAAGGWFVVGPSAWPLLVPGAGRYFAAATAFHQLTDRLGTALGPGLLLTACGAFTAGWALRRRRLSRTRRELTTVASSSLGDRIGRPSARAVESPPRAEREQEEPG